MSKKRRSFIRRSKEYRYRKIFILACEGKVAEPGYFNMLKLNILKNNPSIHIKCLKREHDSAPKHVIKSMEKYLKEKGIKKTDEAWLVIDRDEWPDEQLRLTQTWEKKDDNYGLALSNPKFEFWLLLHYEDGKAIKNAKDCSNRLKRYYPNNQSYIDFNKISKAMIQKAISRAKNIGIPPNDVWKNSKSTSVYKLVENILVTDNQ